MVRLWWLYRRPTATTMVVWRRAAPNGPKKWPKLTTKLKYRFYTRCNHRAWKNRHEIEIFLSSTAAVVANPPPTAHYGGSSGWKSRRCCCGAGGGGRFRSEAAAWCMQDGGRWHGDEGTAAMVETVGWCGDDGAVVVRMW
nr:hypothetical protein [Tanacetum cinerariifolium]